MVPKIIGVPIVPTPFVTDAAGPGAAALLMPPLTRIAGPLTSPATAAAATGPRFPKQFDLPPPPSVSF